MSETRYHSKRIRLSSELLELFQVKGLQPGDKIPPVRSLASELGVSLVTVSKALNDLAASGGLVHSTSRGLFIPHKPRIGYLGQAPGPGNEKLLEEALQALFKHSDDINVSLSLLNFSQLRSGIIPSELSQLDGILIYGSHWDEQITHALMNYSGKIMVINNMSIINALPVYQTNTDCRSAVSEFVRRCNWSAYKRIVVVRASHETARCDADVFSSVLKLVIGRSVEEEIILPTQSPELSAFTYFEKRRQEDWRETLIVSFSGYYTRGICTLFADRTEEMPALFSFDNLEEHLNLNGRGEPFLTAIERQLPEVCVTALDTLLDVIENPGRAYPAIVGVPAKLVIRNSVLLLS